MSKKPITINDYNITDFISSKKASDLYGYTRGTIWRLCKEKILIYYKPAGRLMILEESIKNYKKRKSGPKPIIKPVAPEDSEIDAATGFDIHRILR